MTWNLQSPSQNKTRKKSNTYWLLHGSTQCLSFAIGPFQRKIALENQLNWLPRCWCTSRAHLTSSWRTTIAGLNVIHHRKQHSKSTKTLNWPRPTLSSTQLYINYKHREIRSKRETNNHQSYFPPKSSEIKSYAMINWDTRLTLVPCPFLIQSNQSQRTRNPKSIHRDIDEWTSMYEKNRLLWRRRNTSSRVRPDNFNYDSDDKLKSEDVADNLGDCARKEKDGKETDFQRQKVKLLILVFSRLRKMMSRFVSSSKRPLLIFVLLLLLSSCNFSSQRD